VEHLLAPAQRHLPDLDGALGDDEEAVTRLAFLEECGLEAERPRCAPARELA